VCRALTVLCAAPGRARMVELKRAAVAQEWELTGGATSVDELAAQVADLRPDVLVIDSALGSAGVTAARDRKSVV